MTVTSDPLARAFIAAQRQRDTDRARRGVDICACGAEYTPTTDGRHQHRLLHDHTPCPPRKEGPQ